MRILVLFWVSLIIAAPALSAPSQINYQGMLTDNGGYAVNGTLVMTFSLYDVTTGGTDLWSETKTITVTDGIYSAILGDSIPIDLPFDTPYYLGVTVSGDNEMLPRQPMSTAPTVMFAGQANAVTDGAVTTSAIKDHSIHPSQFAVNCNDGEILVMTASGWGCGSAPE